MKKPKFNSNTLFVTGTRGIPDIQGGIENHCQELYSQLVKKGMQVVVFTRSRYVKDNGVWSEWNGLVLRRVWAPYNKYLEAFIHTFLCVTLVGIYGGKRIHIHAIGPGIFSPYARMLGLKVIVTHHGFDYNRKKWGWFAKRMLILGEYLSLNYAHCVIAVSKQIYDFLINRYKKNIVYLPNAIDVAELVKSSRINMSQETLRFSDNNYIIVVSRLVPEKGIDLLIDVVVHNAELTSLVIVGDSDHPSDYSKMIKSYRNDRIHILGKCSHGNVLNLVSKAKAFVLPSYHEGLPIVLLEALALKVPILASDIPANCEIIIPNETGFLFKTGDKEDLAIQLNKLINLGGSERERIVANGRKLILNNYSWDNNIQLFEEEVLAGV